MNTLHTDSPEYTAHWEGWEVVDHVADVLDVIYAHWSCGYMLHNTPQHNAHYNLPSKQCTILTILDTTH